MKNRNKTREQLIQELTELRQISYKLKALETLHRKTEELLRNTEERYKILVETTDVGCLVLDSHGRVIDANQQFVNFTGYKTLGEIKGRSVLEWTAKYDRKRNLERIKECGREGVVRSVQIDYCTKDNKITSLEIDGTVIETQEGSLILALLRDITERKRLEKQLVQSEERYRTAIEHSNDGVAILLKNKYLYVNQRFLEIFGYDNPEEIVGKKVYKVIHPDDRKRLTQYNLRRQKGLPAPPKYEFKGIRKDGSQVIIEVSPVVTTYRGETVTLIYLRDITDRKRQEEMLDKVNECLLSFRPDAETNIKELFETARAIFRGFWTIYICNLENIYNILNAGEGWNVSEDFRRTYCKKTYTWCMKKTGGSSEPVVINKLDQTPHDTADPVITGKVFKTCIICSVKKGKNIIGFLMVFFSEERTFDPSELKVFSILARGLGVEEERKVALNKLKEHQRMLEISEKNLKKFSMKILSIKEEEKKKLAIALHDEVGSMAVALNSNLSIAEEEIRDKNPRGALKKLNQLKRAVEKAVYSFKKIAIYLRPLNLEILGLSGALREYIMKTARQTKMRIGFNDTLNGLQVNEEEAIVLYRITQEAINNIIKHAHAKKVTINLSSQDHTIRLDIYDNGKGFDPGKISQKPHAEKMGIWGMRESVENLGGMFSIQSVPKQGTEIHITLPTGKEHTA